VARVAGILLAAGESRRMGYPKPLIKIGGRTFLEHTLATMLEVVPRVVVVLGAYAERIRAAVPDDSRVAVTENRESSRGQLSSLRVGIESLPIDIDGVMVHLTDHPLVRADTFRAVLKPYGQGGEQIVIARYENRRGHPVIFDRSVFDELMHTRDSDGARAVVNADPSRVTYVDVADPGVVLDLDTPEDVIKAGLEAPPREW
jgi:molybdenum cofactor cytidylyltransferase